MYIHPPPRRQGLRPPARLVSRRRMHQRLGQGRLLLADHVRHEVPIGHPWGHRGDSVRAPGHEGVQGEIAWRMPRPNLLSVARREAVLALDSHVGPKSW